MWLSAVPATHILKTCIQLLAYYMDKHAKKYQLRMCIKFHCVIENSKKKLYLRKGAFVSVKKKNTHTRTHPRTHTERERKRERERDLLIYFLSIFFQIFSEIFPGHLHKRHSWNIFCWELCLVNKPVLFLYINVVCNKHKMRIKLRSDPHIPSLLAKVTFITPNNDTSIQLPAMN
jgi:hypothetical protein